MTIGAKVEVESALEVVQTGKHAGHVAGGTSWWGWRWRRCSVLLSVGRALCDGTSLGIVGGIRILIRSGLAGQGVVLFVEKTYGCFNPTSSHLDFDESILSPVGSP